MFLNQLRVRGVLGSTALLSYSIGMLLVFILGAYCDYHIIPKVVIGITIVCVVLFYFCPESPTFLMKQGKVSVSKVHEFIERFNDPVTFIICNIFIEN